MVSLCEILVLPVRNFIKCWIKARTMRKIEAAHRNLIIAFGLLFSLGVVLAVSNAACAINMGHLFAPFLYGVALVGLATGGAVTLLFQWKVDKMQLKRILSILPADEASVLTTIIEKGSITQTEIKSRSGLSKVKVSRILSRLEQRNVIEKKPHGNTNLIIKKF